MNNGELIGKVHSAMYHQCQARGYAAPVDVLIDIGVLPAEIRGLAVRACIISRSCLHGEPPKALLHYAPDAGLRGKKRPQTLFLLLQKMGRKEGRRAGT